MSNDNLFIALKSAAEPSWQSYVDHDFVKALGSGDLPRRCFLHYLRQDYVFLIHFARAWSMAVFKSDRLDEMRIAAGTVFALIDQEMKLHVSFCAQNGISEAELAATQEEAETLAYTRFVIDAGLRGDLLDLLVALAPCVLGYGEIGKTLAQQTSGVIDNHPYASWISTYAGDEYQSVCRQKEALLQTVFARLVGGIPENAPRWPDLLKTFDTACRLEAGFWSMGLRPA